MRMLLLVCVVVVVLVAVSPPLAMFMFIKVHYYVKPQNQLLRMSTGRFSVHFVTSIALYQDCRCFY